MNLKKELKFGSKSKNAYPNKMIINLAAREKSFWSPLKLLLIFAVVVTIIAVFSKFAVADRLDTVTNAENALALKQQQIDAINDQLSNFNDVLKEYSAISSDWMTEQERELLDRQNILAILENVIIDKCEISSFSVRQNIMTMTVSKLNLNILTQLINDLESSPFIARVSVESVRTEDNDIRASLTIYLQQSQTEGD